jgi:hypothetical protein
VLVGLDVVYQRDVRCLDARHRYYRQQQRGKDFVLHIHFCIFVIISVAKIHKNKRKAKHKYHFLGISPPKSRVSPFAGFRFCSIFANKI